MEYDKKLMEKLAKELIELWSDCKQRVEKIENLAKQLDAQVKQD